MESYQQCALQLALRFFEIESDSPLTVRDLERFDWMMSKSLSEWQYLGFVDQRPRRGPFVPPNPTERYYMMNPGFARYRNLFDLPSARFLWYSESGHDIFVPAGSVNFDEDLEFSYMNRLQLDD